MNISDINKNIYGCKNLEEGENINYIIKLIEEQQLENYNFSILENNNIFKDINKEIKF